jgi:DNA-binding NarL/FixJ family response regulator
MKKIRVLIVDDHFMVVEGIKSLLQGDPGLELVGAASSGATCLDMVQQHKPEVVLMDINLPDDDGTQLCRKLKTRFPGVFVIGLSTFNKLSVIERMMDNGASGYLLKNASQAELSDAIHQAVKGKTFLSRDIQVTMRESKAESSPVLTRREKEILALIADGFTNQEIADRLFVSVTTVDTHRKNLLQKLMAKNTAALVKIAMDNGLL